MTWAEVDDIQTKCANAMRIWKYKILKKAEWEALKKVESLKPTMFVDNLSLKNMLESS